MKNAERKAGCKFISWLAAIFGTLEMVIIWSILQKSTARNISQVSATAYKIFPKKADESRHHSEADLIESIFSAATLRNFRKLMRKAVWKCDRVTVTQLNSKYSGNRWERYTVRYSSRPYGNNSYCST